MTKTITQGLITIVLFFATWFAFTQIDWMSLFKVEKVTNQTEEKLGNLFWELFQKTEKENTNPFVEKSIDSIVTKICTANKINKDLIKIHILQKQDINAFALPNGHLVIYSDLIANADNPEELAGVIAHEIAHIQQRHVMKKLIKEIGLSVLISTTTGGGSEVVKEAAKMLSSTAFDRGLEKEADIKAVDYLFKAKINPQPFAHFLYKLSDTENDDSNYLSWISTHPDSKERAEYVIEYSRGKKVAFQPILTNATWAQVKEKLSE